ncbi:MAG: sigma-70 factor domain-containing protein, partial [Actinomycetes bacterium]
MSPETGKKSTARTARGSAGTDSASAPARKRSAPKESATTTEAAVDELEAAPKTKRASKASAPKADAKPAKRGKAAKADPDLPVDEADEDLDLVEDVEELDDPDLAEADLAEDVGVVDPDSDAEADEDESEEDEDDDQEGFVIGLADDDAPAQQVVTAGATADPVKDYLKQIGKVALLNAEQEVDLAKRIEAGLFAEEKLASGEKIPPKLRRELEWIANDGRHAKNHLLEA